jgi:hypothetical protein
VASAWPSRTPAPEPPSPRSPRVEKNPRRTRTEPACITRRPRDRTVHSDRTALHSASAAPSGMVVSGRSIETDIDPAPSSTVIRFRHCHHVTASELESSSCSRPTKTTPTFASSSSRNGQHDRERRRTTAPVVRREPTRRIARAPLGRRDIGRRPALRALHRLGYQRCALRSGRARPVEVEDSHDVTNRIHLGSAGGAAMPGPRERDVNPFGVPRLIASRAGAARPPSNSSAAARHSCTRRAGQRSKLQHS